MIAIILPIAILLIIVGIYIVKSSGISYLPHRNDYFNNNNSNSPAGIYGNKERESQIRLEEAYRRAVNGGKRKRIAKTSKIMKKK